MPPTSEKKKRQSFTLKEKVDIVKLIENGTTHQAVAKARNIPTSTVGLIWKRRVDILQQFKASNPNLKKSRKGSFENIDAALYQWFREQRSIGIPLDGPILKAKAKFFAEALGLEDFSASNGWFDGWKRRYDVKFQNLHGEAASVPAHGKQAWLDDKWPVIRAGYSPEDIYNADETGLFFKMLPQKTYNSIFDTSSGKRQSKQRITVLVCANMSGTDKLPLFVIGKSARPRGFPKDLKRLPVTYRSNKKAWMTGILWEEWIRKLDENFRRTKRKVLLLIDNCSAHVEIPHLKNIQIEFLPPNVTSLLQPMDQGVIRNFKVHYRRQMIEKLLAHIELKKELLDIKLLDSIFMCFSAWQAVTATTISNCFRHGGLSSEEEEIELLDTEFNKDTETAFAQLMGAVGAEVELDSMETYFDIDIDVPVCEQRSDDALLMEVCQDEHNTVDSDSEPEVQILEEVEPEIDIATCIEGIRKWTLKSSSDHSLHAHLAAIERIVLNEKVRNRTQKKILDYFPSSST